MRSDRIDCSSWWNVFTSHAMPAGARSGIGLDRGDDWNQFRREGAEFGATGGICRHLVTQAPPHRRRLKPSGRSPSEYQPMTHPESA
jgi:hypothetical protein